MLFERYHFHSPLKTGTGMAAMLLIAPMTNDTPKVVNNQQVGFYQLTIKRKVNRDFIHGYFYKGAGLSSTYMLFGMLLLS
jgi:hypothetical protein